MINFRIVILFISIATSIQAQVGTGQWRLHMAPKAIDIASGNGLVMAAFENGLMEYDPAAGETSAWTDVNALSDLSVSCIHYDAASTSFYVGYKNGNIDRIQNNQVTNIPAIKLASIQGSKKVNRFISHNNLVYAATDLGIVILNPVNNEVKDTWYPSANIDPIMDLVFYHDSVLALTPNGLLRAYELNPALADVNQWKKDNRAPSQTGFEYKRIFADNETLYLLQKDINYGNDNIYEVTTTGLAGKINASFLIEISNVTRIPGHWLIALYDGVLDLNDNFELINVYNNYGTYGHVEAQQATLLDGVLYIADYMNGLVRFNESGASNLTLPGPPKNSYFTVKGAGDKMSVAGGIINKAGFSYSRAGAYTLKDEKWTLFDFSNQAGWDDYRVWDISAVAINPNNHDQLALGGYCIDALMISENGTQIANYYNASNSGLEATTLGNGFICISDLNYDNKGNLWIVNGYANKPLKVLTKSGEWYSFETGVSSKSKYSGRLAIDQNGYKWFAIYDEGLYGYDDGGTPEDASDDRYVNVNEGENTGALPTTNVTAIAVDQDNEIWIGTSNGFAILYNASSALDAVAGTYNTQRIKIDFEGNVEYLLGNTSITDIEIDGGNRKWIGTANAGIFLLSADGLQILASYTRENSPLISNNVIDMHFQEKSGELFIITDVGMVSLRTDASTGDDYEDVQVFPNPVKADFDGVITIQGIKSNSDVKFTDVSGNVVYQTTSNGGTATWNGRNFQGEKVQPGMYLIWTASNDEKGRKTSRVLIQR